ncbi:MAG: hypothetical protein COA78_17920 [Blastopirellula sp.]|nr:MAG: hypothetical protein COA78_17920 [Blastopirellula sp.]
MPNRIVQVNLAKNARDFIGVSLNDLPILDRSNANDEKLRKALGRLAAQPKKDGDIANFFVCDETGGRPHDVICEPVSDRELRSNKDLKNDLKLLEQRLTQVEPEELRTTLTRHFDAIRKLSPAHQSCHFCKWKTPGGTWRLVWLWGFQRNDMEPAVPLICTNRKCKALFVKRTDDPLCPECKNVDVPPEPKKKSGGRLSFVKMMLFVAVILLIALPLAYWYGLNQNNDPKIIPVPPETGLVISPASWTGPVGGTVEFVVKRNSKDVTSQVIARSDSPKVLRFKNSTALALARSPGKSVITFYLGDENATMTINVEYPKNPTRIFLEPKDLTLGIGTTATLKLIGEYEDGGKIDLSEVATWNQSEDKSVFVHNGLVQGLAVGSANIQAMYRASSEQPWLDTTSQVVVEDEKYLSLEIKIKNDNLTVGQNTGVSINAITESGANYSVLGSSELTLNFSVPSIANLEEGLLYALQPGEATLSASFRGLTVDAELSVLPSKHEQKLEVTPLSLQLAVGEQTELDILTSSNSLIQFKSASPELVEVTEDGKLIGHAPGESISVIVSQDNQQVEVIIDVVVEEFQSIAIVPEHISLSVDETIEVRVVGTNSKNKQFDLSQDRIQAERLPSPDYASFDGSTYTLHGIYPTQSNPQRLTLRFGDLKASADIEVVSAPMQLTITPDSALDLPIGQDSQVQIWANYGDGRRVEVMPDQVEWEILPLDSKHVLLNQNTGIATSLKSGGSITVEATYQGQSAGSLTINAVEPPPLTLEIASDVNPLLLGESGQFQAELVAADGSRISADNTEFLSIDEAILAVDSQTGAYTALATGSVIVKATHPSTTTPAEISLEIVATDQGKLELRPKKVRIPVGSQQPLQLYLITKGEEREINLAGNDDIDFAGLGQNSIVWDSPNLVGIQPSSQPFEFSVTWQGMIAKSLIEVYKNDPSKAPTEIRVVPDTVSLAVGQVLSPKVEQKVEGSADEWIELQPHFVQWEVPASDLLWTPPSTSFNPSLERTQNSPDSIVIKVTYQNATAQLVINAKPLEEVPKATDPETRLVVNRDPQGDSISVGQSQRYTIMIEQDGVQEPATGVEWLPAFDNEFVEWNPPILFAKKPGHEQQLSATTNGEAIDFKTQIIFPLPKPEQNAPIDKPPQAIRFITQAGSNIQIPVNSKFTDFKIEAEFENGLVQDITRDAYLVIDRDAQQASVAVSQGQIEALRPGNSTVLAEFRGVRTEEGLQCEVTSDVKIAELEISPANLEFAVGEAANLRVIGYSGEGQQRVSVGDVSSLPGFSWESQSPDTVSIAGGSVQALQVGKSTIIAKLNGLTAAADVVVKEEPADLDESINVYPLSLTLKVGESKSLGHDITITRNGINLIRETEIASSQPDILEVNRDSQSVVGVSPGSASLSFSYRGETQIIPVTVQQITEEPSESAQIIVEPSSGILGVGESQNIRVYLLDTNGERTDRTSSAILSSSDDNIISVRGNELTASGTGDATISVVLPESTEEGEAKFSVIDESYSQLEVVPSSLTLSPGEERNLTIYAIGPEGRRDITQHENLSISIAGEKSDSIELNGSTVQGIVAGQASIDVQLDTLKQQVSVTVVDQPWRDLRIEPKDATIKEGQKMDFQIFAKRGDTEKALTPDDGVEVLLTNTSVADLHDPFSVQGTSPGFTGLRLNFNNLRAEASITVTASEKVDPPATPPAKLPPGLRFIPDILSLQIGTPGSSVRVVKVAADGTEEEVDFKTEMVFDGPDDIVELTWTASGAVFKPLKVGSTKVKASYQGIPTRRPLGIQVVDYDNDARLVVQPNPVSLSVGEASDFNLVQIIPGRGLTPLDVEYEVKSDDDSIVAIDNNHTLRGIAAGETTVVVSPIGVDSQFSKLSTKIAVRVTGTGNDDSQAELVITGPSKTTVGSPSQFRIELITSSDTKDVTSQGASLVIDRDQEQMVEFLPGGIVIGMKSGTVNLKARYKDLISTPIRLEISDQASQFKQLELELDTRAMTINESRSYQLWGYPSQGGARQDITNLIESGKAKLIIQGDSNAIEHQSPDLIGKKPGLVEFAAELQQGADVIQSTKIQIEVVDDSDQPKGILSIEPKSISVHIGQAAPAIQVLSRRPGESQPRQISLSLTSEDSSILEADENGNFIGKAIGKTRLVAQVEDQEVAVDVQVIGNPFESVKISKLIPGDPFSVLIDVKGYSLEELEYRIAQPNQKEDQGWQKTQNNDGVQSVQLKSHEIPFRNIEYAYKLFIESRNPIDKTVTRYPCDFSIRITTDWKIQTDETP